MKKGMINMHRSLNIGYKGLWDRVLLVIYRKSAVEEDAVICVAYDVCVPWKNMNPYEEISPPVEIEPVEVCVFRYGKGADRFVIENCALWDAAQRRYTARWKEWKHRGKCVSGWTTGLGMKTSAEKFLELFDLESGNDRNPSREFACEGTITNYRMKTIRAGNQIEVEGFPIWSTEPALPGEAISRKSAEAIARANAENARKHFGRKMDANFTDADYRIDLTYADDQLPGADQAWKDVRNYLRRVKYACRKNGLPQPRYMKTPDTYYKPASRGRGSLSGEPVKTDRRKRD